MALKSPGVEITIIDESQYLPAAPASVPFILLATAQNKANASGTGIASGTVASNANKLYRITSQRDLVSIFGNPFFYKTTNGTSIQGYELNEYGLLSAYSVLGSTNLIYVLRADIDLAALVGRTTRPVGAVVDGTYWLDTTASSFGIFEWNLSNGQYGSFSNKTPIVITDNLDLQSTITGEPKQTIGNIGDYAVVFISENNDTTVAKDPSSYNTFWFKDKTNEWIQLGSSAWHANWPTVQGSGTPASLTAGQNLKINTIEISVPASPTNTVAGLAGAINANATLTGQGITADAVNGRLEIYRNSNSTVAIAAGTTPGTGAGALLTLLGIAAGTYYTPELFYGTNAAQPAWKSNSATPHPTGSVWIKTTSANLGMNMILNQYDEATATYASIPVRLSTDDWTITNQIDNAGGLNITTNTVYAQYGVGQPLQFFIRSESGASVFTGNDTDPTITAGSFDVKVSVPGSASLSSTYTVTVAGTDSIAFVTAWTGADIPNTTAEINAAGAIVLTHTAGGVIVLEDNATVNTAGFEVAYEPDGIITPGSTQDAKWSSVMFGPDSSIMLSKWVALNFIPNDITPSVYPADKTPWYFSVVNQVDIMTNVGGAWMGYKMTNYGDDGLPASGVNTTDANGPIVSSTAPILQSTGTPLEYGDLWIDTSDLENYPVINRWQNVDGEDQWIRIDNTDQTTENGIIFADARWAPNDMIDPIDDAIPTIQSMLSSDYVDLDAPDPSLYPEGTLLFNTRRSGYNVKEFRLNYFNSASYPGVTLPQETSTWVSVSGLKTSGAPYMGRKAQRNLIVRAMKVAINTNTQIREEDTFFNLICAPNYPELQPDMVTLNNDRNQTAYIIGDTPLRLPDDATAIVDWATNSAESTTTDEDGLVTRNTFLGIYYPSGISTDLTGAEVVVPASHMILRTMIYNDTVAYPWFAPAGQRRGIVDNVSNIGYIDAASGEFIVTKNRIALRDIEYDNYINPIAFFTNIGILNFGNKNSFNSQSSLDRTNVARLVCYLRYQLQTALRPFIFEPNDDLTRAEARNVVQTLLADILTKRGIYDYLVVCDESNNTPERIERNELWVDVAIEPTKAAEFIYVPVRLLNTGEISDLT